MATFVTGATGYLGAYVVARLLHAHDGRLALLVRAQSEGEAKQRLWRALQPHMTFAEFVPFLAGRIDVVLGDITARRLGLGQERYEQLSAATDSVIHIAASLSRRSARKCFDVNLKGTLEVIELARTAQRAGGLRRFSDVSTTAVAGYRQSEVVHEDSAIDWARSDYDPYARTKKFCEHMVETLLPGVERTVFRPSMVIGDSRTGQTSQFEMARALIGLARMRVIPLPPDARQDIVPADYVGRAIADLHMGPARHGIYHLSAGKDAPTNAEIMAALRISGRPVPHLFAPSLKQPFGVLARALASVPEGLPGRGAGALLQAFWPYICFDTVFDNSRVAEALGEAPARFTSYGSQLADFCLQHGFRYPYAPMPTAGAGAEVRSSAA